MSDKEPEKKTITGEQAMHDVTNSLATGNLGAAYDAWLWLMSATADEYWRCQMRTPNPDRRGAVVAAGELVAFVNLLVPGTEDFKPLKSAIGALARDIVEAPAPKERPKRAVGGGALGVLGRSNMQLQIRAGIALACVTLLEKHGHRKPVSFVKDQLKNAKHNIKHHSTVSKWKDKLDVWEIAAAYRNELLQRFQADPAIWDCSDLNQLEKFVTKAIKTVVIKSP